MLQDSILWNRVDISLLYSIFWTCDIDFWEGDYCHSPDFKLKNKNMKVLIKLARKRGYKGNSADISDIILFLKDNEFEINWNVINNKYIGYFKHPKVTMTMGPYDTEEILLYNMVTTILKNTWYGFHGRKIEVW